MRLFLAAVVGLAVAGITPAAPVPKAAKKSVEQKLLGKWKLTESPNGIGQRNDLSFFVILKEGGVVELRYEYANGRPPFTYTGTYKVVDGEKIDYTIDDKGYKKAEVLVIDKLADDEIEWTDPENKKEKYVRVADDGK